MAGSKRMQRKRAAQQAQAIRTEADVVTKERKAKLEQVKLAKNAFEQKAKSERRRRKNAAEKELAERRVETPIERVNRLLSNSTLPNDRIHVEKDTLRRGNIIIAIQQEGGQYLSYTFNPTTRQIKANERLMMSRQGFHETLTEIKRIISS